MDWNPVVGAAGIILAALVNSDRGRILDRLKRLEDEFEDVKKQARDDNFVVRIDRLEGRAGWRRKTEDR